MRYQRGILAALKTNPENLTLKRLQKRDEYLAAHPAIKHIYCFKQRLHRLLMKRHCTSKKCKRLLPIFTEMVKRLKQIGFKHLSCRTPDHLVRRKDFIFLMFLKSITYDALAVTKP